MIRFFKILLLAIGIAPNVLLGVTAAARQAENIAKFEQRFEKLPNILVKYGEREIDKKTAFKALFERYKDLDKKSDAEVLDRLKDVVNDKIYLDITALFLTRYNFEPNYDRTYNYLIDSEKKLPKELKKLQYQSKNIHELASDKTYQLTVATLFYLKKHFPDKTKVTPSEIEFFYRANQNVFMYDAVIDINFIAVDKKLSNSRSLINHAYAQLLQGVAFEKLAEIYNKDLPRKYYTPATQARLIEEASILKVKEFSPVIEEENVYAIVQMKSKEAPKYIPLKSASFFIQSTIESRKCAVELQNILEKSLKHLNIEYFF